MQKSGKKVNHIDACFDKKAQKGKAYEKKMYYRFTAHFSMYRTCDPGTWKCSTKEMETQCYQENTDR